MFGAASADLPQRIAFVADPHLSMIAFTSAVEPLRSANRAAGRELQLAPVLPRCQAGGSQRGIALNTGAISTGPRARHHHPRSGIDGHPSRTAASSRGCAHRLSGVPISGRLPGSRPQRGLGWMAICTIHWENTAAFAEDFRRSK
jgi:transcriptional regulator GlxA family with amidase domain